MIKITNLRKAFGSRLLFDDFSLNIENGEFVVFSGVSGSGKSTLLHMIGGIEPFDLGDIQVNGYSLKDKRNRRKYFLTEIGFLFQNFALIDNKTAEQNLKMIKNNARSEVSFQDALEFVGMENKIKQPVYTLSGGEQQRIAVARLLLKKCNVILADEPTGSLDRANADAVFELLSKLNGLGKTVIVVSHDENIKNKGKRVISL